MCEYCHTATGQHALGCPNEPEDEAPDPFQIDLADKAMDAADLWDDDRWNK
jgi:hypothetical protein